MLHLVPSRSTLRAAVILAAGFLAACGSSRKVSESGDVCLRCHGGANAAGNAAPPKSVDGATGTTDVSVGAHQAHLVAGRLRGPIACDECHVVPADMPAHEAEIARIGAGTAQRVTFGTLADKGAAVAAWNRASEKCSNTYCHGATINHGGTNHEPTWTIVDPVTHPQAACGTCHGYPPPTPHPASPGPLYCGACHSATTPDGFTITIDPINGASTHIDGLLTIDGGACTGDCTCCHGAPPATGAHLAHVTSPPTTYGVDSKTADTLATTALTYDFGCGSCHPTDPAQHTAGAVDLSPSSATVGSLKARNDAGAAYNAADGSCSGVYCHSSGQATPAFVASPGWFSGATLGCGGCHANPPSYASGGAGSATANSHIGLLDESDGLTYETGHFGGFPAMFHDGSFHGKGTQDSAPITCQTCHYDTTDGVNGAGPSAFYYLDTSGSYDLSGTGTFCFGGTGAACTGGTITEAYSCTVCHDGAPPAQGGHARPYYHVDGARNVAFDKRTAFSGTPTLPAAPNTPTRPYWFTNADPAIVGAGAMEGTTASFDLSAAQWNASNKTCASVACHFNTVNRSAMQWGEPLTGAYVCNNTCATCHFTAQPTGCP